MHVSGDSSGVDGLKVPKTLAMVSGGRLREPHVGGVALVSKARNMMSITVTFVLCYTYTGRMGLCKVACNAEGRLFGGEPTILWVWSIFGICDASPRRAEHKGS
jgi:hypothetical protein